MFAVEVKGAVLPGADIDRFYCSTKRSSLSVPVSHVQQHATIFMPPSCHVILVSTSLPATSQGGFGKLSLLAAKGATEKIARDLAKDLGRKKIGVHRSNGDRIVRPTQVGTPVDGSWGN